MSRLPGLGDAAERDLSDLSLPAPPVPGVPPVLRDQLVMPYIAGRDFARAIVKSQGQQGLKDAWSRPPESTEQVLHPEKYTSPEAPRPVDLAYAPREGKLINEGVLGELLSRTFLGQEGTSAATVGWGGDRYRVWDRSGRTLLVWRSVWDSARDADEFLEAALARLGSRSSAKGRRDGFSVFARGSWRYALGSHAGAVVLVSSDDSAGFESAVAWHTGAPRRP
jgi:hypothetical protein